MVQKQRFALIPVDCLMLAVSLLFLTTSDLFGAQSSTVSLVTDSHIGPATRHGANKVRLALRAKGIRIEQTTSLEKTNGNLLLVMGLSGGSGPAVELHNSLDIPKPKGAESLLLRQTSWFGKKTLLVSGSDDRGLMYALLDVADRIGWSISKFL